MDILLGKDEFTVPEDNFIHINTTCPLTPGLRIAEGVEVSLNSTMAILGVPLNILVLLIQVLSNRITGFSTAALYMTNLCLANLITVLTLPVILLSNTGRLSISLGACKFVSMIYYCSCTVGFASVGIISVDRYKLMSRQHRQTRKISTYSYTVLGMTWVAALFCGVPAAIFTTVLSHGKRDGEIMHKTCVLFFDHNHVRTTLVSFKILLCIVWGFVPVCVMTWFYSFFYKKLKQAAYKKRSRTLTFICILLISFLMLQTPYVTIALFDAYALLTWPLDCEHISHREAIVTLSKVVPNIHCVINPILYAFLGNDFYNKLKHFFRGNLFSRRAFALAQQSMNSDKAWTRTGRSGGSTLAKEITYRQK